MHTDLPLLFTFTFYLFGVLAVGSALLFVTRTSPVAAALWLVNVMFCLAAEYVLLDAHFVGVVQILVYAGAIMVVFIFVVMLLNLGHPEAGGDFRSRGTRLAAAAVAVLMAAEVLTLLKTPWPQLASPDVPENVVRPIAQALFTDYLLAFEITSVLLLVAIIGAVTLAKRGTSS